MTFSAFPYIGGKSKLVGWILDHLPAHTTYVEPFGGSAAVLLNKPRSSVEIYNDADGDVVNFFDVARRRPDELREWCKRTPFSEELHNRWVEQFYQEDRPDDELARAGRWLFLRYSQFAGKVASPSGFKRECPADGKGAREARNWSNVPDRIDRVADRFSGVSVVNEDYQAVIDRYDSPETLFYVDPPYFGKEDMYRESAEHAALRSRLESIEGRVVVSYTDLPEGYDSHPWVVLERGSNHNAGGTSKEVTERLACNFDPELTAGFVDESTQQQTLLSTAGVRTDGGDP